MKKWTIFLIIAGMQAISVHSMARQYVICIDPGHGGKDPGAEGCGLKEKDIVLNVGLKLRDLLNADPAFKPIMTRITDVFISLSNRTDYANSHNADRFASIHANADSGQASGIETYCYGSGSAASFDQRDKIQEEMLNAWPLPNRGTKTANFYVIHHSNMPATLSELAFVDYCAKDAKYLGSNTHRQEAAYAHYLALRRSLDISGPPPDGTGTLKGIVFEDVGAGTNDMSHRLPGAKVNIKGTGVDMDVVAGPGNAQWQTDLAAGAYTISASLTGYVTATRQCTVTAKGTTWCSIGLKPVATSKKGTLKGVVYEDKGDGSTVRLDGALVHVTGSGTDQQAGVAASTAYWEFSLDPGSYEVEASATGYQAGTRQCTVSSGNDTWCSVGLKKNSPPPPQTGNMKGFVYDLSRGTAVRLKGADVSLDGQNQHLDAIASQSDGSFDFTGLPAGEYTLTAGIAGFLNGTRQCTVESGLTMRCSVGLEPVPTSTDEGGTIQDAGQDTGNDSNPVEDVWQNQDTGGTTPDPGQVTFDAKKPPAHEDGYMDKGNNQADTGIAIDNNATRTDDNNTLFLELGRQDSTGDANDAGGGGGGGCSTGTGHTTTPWVLGLVLVVLLGLRMGKMRIAAMIALIFGLGCQQPPNKAKSRSAMVPSQAVTVCNLGPVTKAGDWTMPVISPNSRFVSFTTPLMDRLFVVDIRNRDTRLVTKGRRVGFYPKWMPDSTIAIRTPDQTGSAVPALSIQPDGHPGPVPRGTGLHLVVENDRVFLIKAGKKVRISPAGDRFCCAVPAPGSQRVAFLGLSTGLYVYDLPTARLFSLGQGNHPAFSDKGKKVFFDRCLDDGHRLTGCKLILAVIHHNTVHEYPLKINVALPRYPSVTPDTKGIAFTAEGRIWKGSLDCR